MLARRTQYQDTMNDARYWHSRSVAAVRSRWLDVIATECTKLSACYAVIARQHKTGCTDEGLTNMAITSYNHVTHIPDAPSSCGFSPDCRLGSFCATIPVFLLCFRPPHPHVPLATGRLSTLTACQALLRLYGAMVCGRLRLPVRGAAVAAPRIRVVRGTHSSRWGSRDQRRRGRSGTRTRPVYSPPPHLLSSA